jgi:hypothetical protein
MRSKQILVTFSFLPCLFSLLLSAPIFFFIALWLVLAKNKRRNCCSIPNGLTQEGEGTTSAVAGSPKALGLQAKWGY